MARTAFTIPRRPEESYPHLVDEYCTVALNEKSGLFGPDETLTERLRAAGAHTILDLAEREIFQSPWALYRLRRVYFAPATADRSVEVALRGTPEYTQQIRDRLYTALDIPTITDRRHHTRLWLARRPPQSKKFPHTANLGYSGTGNSGDYCSTYVVCHPLSDHPLPVKRPPTAGDPL
ncbi:hypothetical protein ACQP1G_42650 [Nocardia sp. CA-107356]|uniref:hypothetical protein n=1 Tax=Nocardia sp. CA-107356 TaxID=3239972 RepID=UPI003D8A13EC